MANIGYNNNEFVRNVLYICQLIKILAKLLYFKLYNCDYDCSVSLFEFN